jgi:prepilin-type N-terminal cleavage/methylation domain-containing protein
MTAPRTATTTTTPTPTTSSPPAHRPPGGAFTLVEVLIVVVILGILAAIAVPQFSNASTDARRSALQSTVQSVRSQINLYKLQHGQALPTWRPIGRR